MSARSSAAEREPREIAPAEAPHGAPAAGRDGTAGPAGAPPVADDGLRDRASALRTIRRLDWRFLLPDPRLERAALFGATQDSLAEALLRHVAELDLVGQGTGTGGEYPLVVVSGGRLRMVRAAASLLAPGGHLYWELPRRRAARPAAPVGALRSEGFDEIRAYWAMPHVERCTRYVPLTSPTEASRVLTRSGRATGVRGPAVGAVVRLAGRLGLLPWLLPSVCLIARKAR